MDEPKVCAGRGRPYRPNRTLVSFMHCWDCPPAARVGGGHTTWWCRYCGWLAAPGHTPPGWVEPLPDDLRVAD